MFLTIISAVSFFLERRELEKLKLETWVNKPDYRGPLHEMNDFVLKTFENRTSEPDKQNHEHVVEMEIIGDELNVKRAESDSESRRQAWERGEMDFMGADSFDNIMRKLNESMGCSPAYCS